jgi:hypothetical protein
MVAAHVMERPPLVAGRAAALFAVLAGVSLARMSRRTRSLGLVARAVLIAAWGLVLGELDSGLAVILTYYGVLFLLGLPFLRLGARALFGWALAWTVAGPVLSQLLRPHLPVRGTASPEVTQLAHPGHLLSELLLTGYYPCLTWLAYLLLGMAIGRCDLRSRPLHAGLAMGGLSVAFLAFAVSRSFTQQPWVLRRLLPDVGGYGDVSTPDAFVHAISAGMHGTTPAGGSWAWLLVVAPHSGTPFDLLQTGGSAALVIGVCLLTVSVLSSRAERVVAVLFGAGTMTLSLYSLHVLLRTPRFWPAEEPSSFGWHVLVLLTIGAAFVAAGRKGPLEAALAWVSAAATRWQGRCPSPSGPPPPRSGRTRPRR